MAQISLKPPLEGITTGHYGPPHTTRHHTRAPPFALVCAEPVDRRSGSSRISVFVAKKHSRSILQTQTLMREGSSGVVCSGF